MYIDKELECYEGDLTGATGTEIMTGIIDLGAAGNDIGDGEKLMAYFTVNSAITSDGSATCNIQLVNDDAAALTSPVVLAQTGVLAKTVLVDGYTWRVPLPATPLRYLGFQVVIATAVLTAGTIECGITKDYQTNRLPG